MKIKVTTPIATPGLCFVPGVEYEMADGQASRLIAAGQAVAVDADPKPPTRKQPVTMDQKPGPSIEDVEEVKPPAAGTPAKPAAATPTAVELAKKGGKA